MTDIAAVILNYNDSKAVMDLARTIAGYGSIDRIIVVDNASTDGSAEILSRELDMFNSVCLERYGRRKVILIASPSNGGYGSGNDIGVRYAKEHLGAKYCLIANPDVRFDEELVYRMREIFNKEKNAAAAGAVMRLSGEGPEDGAAKFSYAEYLRSGWKCRGFWGELMACGPVLKRLFSPFINFSRGYYERQPEYVRVYAIHGSLLMVDTDRFLSAGGYDEDMFLYMEEYALAHRLKKSGCETFLVKKYYEHEGSHSITGAGNGAAKRQKFRQESERIYFKRYLGAGKLKMLLLRLIQSVVMLETRIVFKERS